MLRSRCTSVRPRATWLRKVLIRAARAFQRFTSGARIRASAANSATAPIVTNRSNCWRFLICTFSSFAPGKTEAELQGWGLAAGRPKVCIVNLGHPAQLLQGLQEHLVISRCARAGNHV